MGFRYQNRINTGKGTGFNVSGSGLSPSVRTRLGAIGTKGFTVRTGIPGFTFRKGFSKRNSSAILAAVVAFGLIYLAVLIVWNVCRLLVWCGAWVYCQMGKKKAR